MVAPNIGSAGKCTKGPTIRGLGFCNCWCGPCDPDRRGKHCNKHYNGCHRGCR